MTIDYIDYKEREKKMPTNIEAPSMGESISEATVARWEKTEGEHVNEDELIAELETDKVNLEVVAPASGTLSAIKTPAGSTVSVGQLMGIIEENGKQAESTASASSKTQAASATGTTKATKEEPAPIPDQTPEPSVETVETKEVNGTNNNSTNNGPDAGLSEQTLSPAVRKLVEESGMDESQIQKISGTGKGGRITKADVIEFMAKATVEGTSEAAPGVPAAPTESVTLPETKPAASPAPAQASVPTAASSKGQGEEEERVPMSNLRKTVATRLKTAQNTAAMLTTYNEVDMHAVMTLRKEHKEAFEKKHGVKLGFMSFFTKAVVEALQTWKGLNAEIQNDDLIYKKYYNIGIAVSTPKGLMVPVLRGAEHMSFADIEGGIAAYGQKARDGKLGMDDMQGGTFTITNGGVFGSMMSMPILNFPQAGILGMHAIKERPVVVNGEIKIRPMMYLALTYDHRIVDGREAVSFLKQVKESLEDPARLLLQV